MQKIGLLCLSTIGLYGGGVVLNDVFDAKLDKEKDPKGQFQADLSSKTSAAILGIFLLLNGYCCRGILRTFQPV